MRMTTTSPALVGSPTRVVIWTPLGKAGLSFHVSASGASCVCLSCAIAEHETAIKAAAIKSFFIAVLLYAASRRKPDIRQRGEGPMVLHRPAIALAPFCGTRHAEGIRALDRRLMDASK